MSPTSNMPRSPSACPIFPASRHRRASPATIPAARRSDSSSDTLVPASTEEYEKENKNPLLLVPGVKIGKEGLEETLEPVLRGQPGGQRVEVTARGKLVKELEPKPDISGGTVQLTGQFRPSPICGAKDWRSVGLRRGHRMSTSGDILAMPSMPSFDPNNFSDGISQAEWKMLSEDDHHPARQQGHRRAFIPPGRRSSHRWRSRCSTPASTATSMSIAQAALPSAITSFTAIKHHRRCGT